MKSWYSPILNFANQVAEYTFLLFGCFGFFWELPVYSYCFFFFFCTELLKNSLLNTCLIYYKGNTRFLGILIQWGLQQAHRVSQKPAVHLFRILCSEFKQHWLLKLAIMEFPWFSNQGKLESSKIQGSHSPLWHSPLSDTPVHRLS